MRKRLGVREDQAAFAPPSPKQAVNVTLDAGLVAEARELGLNLSQACEQGLRHATDQERARRWVEENKAAMDSINEWVEKNGIPFIEYRKF